MNLAAKLNLRTLSNQFLFWLKAKVRSIGVVDKKELGEFVKKALGESNEAH